MLPDDVLLAIFYFCADEDSEQDTKNDIEAWQSLVHVSQRWRSVVFGSPCRLNLRLVCTEKTHVRDKLCIWPPLSLVIQSEASLTKDVDNIIAVFELRDRVDRIELFEVNSSPLEMILAAMQKPFPELLFMRLESKLLLSSTHLYNLILLNIPHSGYISPEAIVTALSSLTDLESLALEFQSPLSHPGRASRRPPPPTRTVLPVLVYFSFKGVYEYLDDLVARIDAPQVNLYITFFNDIVFDAPQPIQFIGRTPSLESLKNAHVVFGDGHVTVKSSQTSDYGIYGSLTIKISCRELDWQVSSLEQVYTSCLPPLSALEDLLIYKTRDWLPDRQDNTENMLWLELLHQFTAVKHLYLSKEFAPRIVPALQELVGARTTEVLPALQNIFLEELQSSGPIQEGIGRFVGARRLSGHPMTVSLWEREPESDYLREVYD
jgi:hypothetical protein